MYGILVYYPSVVCEIQRLFLELWDRRLYLIQKSVFQIRARELIRESVNLKLISKLTVANI